EACLRALTFFDGFHGEDGRAWLLAIVRNTCYDWLRKNRRSPSLTGSPEELDTAADSGPNPEALQLRQADSRMLRESLEALPEEYREVLVLREMEEMSYKQISQVTDLPIGTVMSRLARGRKRLGTLLAGAFGKGDAIR
ncbi:MAG TPA: sigma-70 family RNA polymerase sigma factor, partial [Bryobacteraceae bacterium]